MTIYSSTGVFDGTGLTIEQNAYYPFGARHSYGGRWLSSLTNRHKFNGKEEQTTGSLGYLDYGARMYDPQTARWLTQDPLAQKYYPHSPYSFSGNNPVLYVDINGLEWFYYSSDGKSEPTWHWRDEKTYNTGIKDNKGDDIILKGHSAVVIFNGSLNERLGEGDNLFGLGAILADVIVYGPRGANDIKNYKGYTMSSDPSKYGVVADGTYNVNRISNNDLGPYKTPFAVNDKGKVPALGNFNPAYPSRDPAYLDHIYIHRSNLNGWAGWKIINGEEIAVSKGCLLIVPSRYNNNRELIQSGWDQFYKQLENINNFLLQIQR